MEKLTVWPRVVSDMVERNEFGAKKYGKYLTTNSGENFLQHAYEEALDLAVYLKGKIMEQQEKDQINTELTFIQKQTPFHSLEEKAEKLYGCNKI